MDAPLLSVDAEAAGYIAVAAAALGVALALVAMSRLQKSWPSHQGEEEVVHQPEPLQCSSANGNKSPLPGQTPHTPVRPEECGSFPLSSLALEFELSFYRYGHVQQETAEGTGHYPCLTIADC